MIMKLRRIEGGRPTHELFKHLAEGNELSAIENFCSIRKLKGFDPIVVSWVRIQYMFDNRLSIIQIIMNKSSFSLSH